MLLSSKDVWSELRSKVEDISGTNLASCYQCGKCSAGCPMADLMDIPPHKVIRYLQIGLGEKVLRSNTMWFCAACFTCESRCPKSVDLSRVMEALRAVVLREGKSFVDPCSLPAEVVAGAPQQGLVSGFRKYTG